MAEYQIGNMPPDTQFDVRTIVTLSGAALSLALIVGIGFWGYKLILRDVSGLPVVQAFDGPMRIAPEDPGGEVASNTGLSVNELVSVGVAAEPEDSVRLAPPEVQPPLEDLMRPAGERIMDEASLRAQEEGEISPLAEAGEVTEGDQAPGVMADPNVMSIAQDVDPDAPLTAEQILALADEIARGVTPLTAEEVEAAQVVSASVPGVVSSPRPQARPLQLTAARPTAAAEPEVVLGQPLTAGTPLVQFGDFDSASQAEQEWVRLTETFADFMAGKRQIIQRTEQTGRQLWRLRASGFADLAEAQRFCAAFVAEEAVCFPVVVR